MEIEKLKRQYKNQWMLVEVLKNDKLGRPMDVKLIAHSKSRDDTYDAMIKTKVKHIAHFYTGEIKQVYALNF